MATDLQLSEVLSEFARTMVRDFPIQSILDRLVERIVDIIPVAAAAVTLISEGSSSPHYISASNSAALRFEKLQSELSEGPCLAASRSDGPVSVPDLAADARFTRFAPHAVEAGLVAMFAFPLRHGEHDVLGALDLYRDAMGPLDDHALHAAQTLAEVAAAYILNAQARQELIDISEQFQEHSLHDSLTGRGNRVLFGQLVDHAVARTRRFGKQIAVLFADLDRFKDVNDAYGHQVGDELLVAVARRLETLVRPSDSLARLAGDEFVILCEDLSDATDVEGLAKRIGAGMNQPFHLTDHELHMTASIGIAYSGAGDDVPDQLLRDADTAMYQAKRRGGAGHQVLDLRDQEQTNHHRDLGNELYGVLERKELHAFYQPMIATDDGRVLGVEALLRCIHPTRGLVPPPS